MYLNMGTFFTVVACSNPIVGCSMLKYVLTLSLVRDTLSLATQMICKLCFGCVMCKQRPVRPQIFQFCRLKITVFVHKTHLIQPFRK